MIEKKLRILKIDPEFEALIPPLNGEELAMLEESIVANGCETPLTVWDGVIVDGHNRYAICQKHSIPFAVEEKAFGSREAVMLWMLRNQLGRRNLNNYQRSELVLKLEPLMACAAEKRMRAGKAADPTQNSAEGAGETRRNLGKLAGVSHDTIKKVKKLNESADEETKGKLRRGEVTVNKAYTELMHREHEHEKRVCERCKAEKPIAEFAIPSNRHGFSELCKACEKEIEAAAKAAAEVAAGTTDKVETYPVRGMAMYRGAPIHVVSPLPDEPEMMPHVMSVFDTAADAFLATVGTSLRMMTRGIATPENRRIYEDALQAVARKAHAMFETHMKEMDNE